MAVAKEESHEPLLTDPANTSCYVMCYRYKTMRTTTNTIPLRAPPLPVCLLPGIPDGHVANHSRVIWHYYGRELYGVLCTEYTPTIYTRSNIFRRCV